MSKERSTVVFQPVSLLLLDINMPIVNGMQTAEQIRKLYGEAQANTVDNANLVRPLIVFLS